MTREYHVPFGAVEIESGGARGASLGQDGIIGQTGHLKGHYYVRNGARFYLLLQ
jgi:hypothetical protein